MITSDEEAILRIMKRVAHLVSEARLDLPPPVTVAEIHRIIRKELNSPDPYEGLKKRSTEKALSLESAAQALIGKSPDRFAAAVRFAIAGNILDFGAKTAWDEKRVEDSFALVSDKTVKNDSTAELKDKISVAKTVLILADNAGEAVFDRVLIENLPGHPHVIYAVKESPVINDVTMEDALDAGIHRVASIVSNGADIPGTWLPSCSEEFLAAYRTADVVISKGQANFECLSGDSQKAFHREVFFLLQVKCESLALRNGFTLGDWIVARL